MTLDFTYQEGIDLAWIAVDQIGMVGVFTTGGSGPIPVSAFPATQSVPCVEELISELPAVSSFELLIPYKRPDDFLGFASRGLFAFDWKDVHIPSSKSTDSYQIVCRPTQPIQISQLPEHLRNMAFVTIFPNVLFSNGIVSCVYPRIT